MGTSHPCTGRCDRLANKQQAATLSVASNTLLVILKVLAGLASGSVSILSEAIHSGIDLIAAIIAMFSVRAASVPADEQHRYGHGKIENFSALVEGFLIIVAAGWIIWEAIRKLRGAHGAPEVGVGLWVMGASAAVNWFISSYLIRVAKTEDSMALHADGMHLRTDVYTSLGVFVGLLMVRITGIGWLDPVVALIVAVMITHAGWELCREAIQPLLDARLPKQEETRIASLIESNANEFISFHGLRTRRAGSERYIDFHLVVHRSWSLEHVHQLCDRIEQAIQAEFPRSEVLIHPEPCDPRCPNCEL
ncbi:MAG: cation efflux family protein [Firmicutes bacterium]|nr:cation efflux family protein [Bacillota bacterium]